MVLHGWVILLTFALSNRSYMEDRYIIYLHVNKINNKVYVGIIKHSKALKGRSKSAGGFIWKYKEDYI